MDEISILLANLVAISGIEIILGIDSLILITFLVSALPEREGGFVIIGGLFMSLLMKLTLLYVVNTLIGMTTPITNIFNMEFSVASFCFIVGGSMLVVRAGIDLFDMFGNNRKAAPAKIELKNYAQIMANITVMNLVLALDTVFIGISLTDNINIIAFAVVMSLAVMLMISHKVTRFINKYFSVRIIALCFLVLIGIYLIFLGFGIELSKQYLYSSLAFALFVEWMNVIFAKRNLINAR